MTRANEYRVKLLEKFEIRLGHQFDSINYKIASVTQPALNQYWASTEEEKRLLKLALQSAIRIDELHVPFCPPRSLSVTNTSPTKTDFLNFQTDSLPVSKPTQVDLYLADRRKDLAMLNDYPNVKKNMCSSDII